VVDTAPPIDRKRALNPSIKEDKARGLPSWHELMSILFVCAVDDQRELKRLLILGTCALPPREYLYIQTRNHGDLSGGTWFVRGQSLLRVSYQLTAKTFTLICPNKPKVFVNSLTFYKASYQTIFPLYFYNLQL